MWKAPPEKNASTSSRDGERSKEEIDAMVSDILKHTRDFVYPCVLDAADHGHVRG